MILDASLSKVFHFSCSVPLYAQIPKLIVLKAKSGLLLRLTIDYLMSNAADRPANHPVE